MGDKINNSGSQAADANQVFKSSVIRLGAGNDTLALSAASNQTAGIDGLTVVGGAGADALTVQAIGTAGSGTFAFERPQKRLKRKTQNKKEKKKKEKPNKKV